MSVKKNLGLFSTVDVHNPLGIVWITDLPGLRVDGLSLTVIVRRGLEEG